MFFSHFAILYSSNFLFPQNFTNLNFVYFSITFAIYFCFNILATTDLCKLFKCCSHFYDFRNKNSRTVESHNCERANSSSSNSSNAYASNDQMYKRACADEEENSYTHTHIKIHKIDPTRTVIVICPVI